MGRLVFDPYTVYILSVVFSILILIYINNNIILILA